MTNLTHSPNFVARFSGDLDRLAAANSKLGVAVSGGPDSLALLLLSAAARPQTTEAATIDHALRAESRAEAEMVAGLCDQIGIRHAILTVEWDEKPQTALQERARSERYRLLGQWAKERGISAVLTAHHADDQAETLLMRLNRGSGVRGLAAMRPVRSMDGGVQLVRPLLGWTRAELGRVCADSGIQPVCDPSNDDDNFERVRVRKAIAEAGWLDSEAIARSAGYLGDIDLALDWAADAEWTERVDESAAALCYRPGDAPREIRRRIVARAVCELATEGEPRLRGHEIERLLDALSNGSRVTLRGVLCSGGEEWRFSRAPKRRS